MRRRTTRNDADEVICLHNAEKAYGKIVVATNELQHSSRPNLVHDASNQLGGGKLQWWLLWYFSTKRNFELELLSQKQKIPTSIGTLTYGRATTNIKCTSKASININKLGLEWMKFNEHEKIYIYIYMKPNTFNHQVVDSGEKTG